MYFWSFKSHKIPLQILLKSRYLSSCTYIRALEEKMLFLVFMFTFQKVIFM